MNEAYTHQITHALRCHMHVKKRTMNVKREVWMWKETCKWGLYTSNRPCAEMPYACQKQDYECEKRTIDVKRDLWKRPIHIQSPMRWGAMYMSKTGLWKWKKTHERGLHISNCWCAEMPCTCHNENYECEKRPIQETNTIQKDNSEKMEYECEKRTMNVRRRLWM